MATFSERLKALRITAGLSQEALALAVETSARNYRRYEAGVSNPALSFAVALADFFDVSLDYLVGRSDDPRRVP